METASNQFTLQGFLVNSWMEYKHGLGYICNLVLQSDGSLYLITVQKKQIRAEIMKYKCGCLLIISGTCQTSNKEMQLSANCISVLDE